MAGSVPKSPFFFSWRLSVPDPADLSPGTKILLDGQPAEVVWTRQMGELPFLRVYQEGTGLKTVCLHHVDVEVVKGPDDHLKEGKDKPPLLDRWSPKWFNLRAQAARLQLAFDQGQLLSLSTSRVRMEPYQLACVNQVMSKLRQRSLIADDVGLGKTVEAGLILKELSARRRADRMLFVVPAHLQKKWVRDMERFFNIDLTVADRTWVEAERRRHGEAANIWDQEGQHLVTSMAFLRQDEFQPALEEAFWDVVVVDECHKAAKRGDSPSKISQTVERVAHQSDALLLLSATPHDGKERSFRSLLSYIDPFLLAGDEPLTRETVDRVMVRRGKHTIYDDEGNRVFPDRDVRTVPVELTDQEEGFYADVTEYVRDVYNRSEKLNAPVVGFAMALMQKRLVSSVGAIRETLRRRLENLVSAEELAISAETRAYLEGEDLEEDARERVEDELSQVTVPGADEAYQEEIDTLRELVDQAESVAVDSKASKVTAFIQTLMEEQPDEKVLLFTEYTDTLEYLLGMFEDEPWSDEILVIHGGVDRDERARIEDEFNYGTSRLLVATDAASEGIDLQESCHIMINYELPWNPNRLEQRIGRLHRYGQDKEVKVWNFQLEGTREAEIFRRLEAKLEEIREKLGSTADVLGLLDDIDLESFVMESVQNREPPSATGEQLELMLEDRERTLKEWLDRSPIDCSTFDADSRRRIMEVVDESEDVLDTGDVREFCLDAIRLLGGDVRENRDGTYSLSLPDDVAEEVGGKRVDRVTFDRETALERDDTTFLAADSEILTATLDRALRETSENKGRVGLKVLPFLEEPGILFVSKLAFEDGSGEVVREELAPVFVGTVTREGREEVGRKILEGASLDVEVADDEVRELVALKPELEEVADAYLARKLDRLQGDLEDDRQQATERELQDLREYEREERERLEAFIEKYRERAEKGAEDMTIAIRRQESRLRELQRRAAERRENIEQKGRVIALAPERVNLCLAFPG
jgi:superfamily II DNA or RNA helicase